jgi:2-methylcitrate dehydratase PrpD
VELMGRLQPDDGMQARFSAAHTMAAALADGALGREQFRDERVTRADVRRLRGVTRFVPSPGIARDEALVEVRLDDGTTVSEQVAHARGSLARPLSDDELAAKARDLIEPVLPGRTDRIVAASRLDGPAGLTALVDAITPKEA